jgi:hypothetical protein
MTTPANENLLAASAQLYQAAGQLAALAAGETIPNVFFGIWENEPEMIDPTMESISKMITGAQTMLG